jgi:hypothetical protein
VPVFNHYGAVFLRNHHLNAVFGSVDVIWLSEAPKISDSSSVVAPLETGWRRADSVGPVARVVFPVDA